LSFGCLFELGGIKPMKFSRVNLQDCHLVNGTVVVIDVLRAFTTAAYAFAAGANDISLVGSIEDAFALKNRLPNAMIVGEEGGLPISGFDHSNSPTEIDLLDLSGKHIIQRTTAGTQGVVLSKNAGLILTSSFVVAGATADYLRVLDPEMITFVITGADPKENLQNSKIRQGDEDLALAHYLEALLKGKNPDPKVYLQRVYYSQAGRKFLDSRVPEFPSTDLVYATDLDSFDFAMQVKRENGQFVMKPVFLGKG